MSSRNLVRLGACLFIIAIGFTSSLQVRAVDDIDSTPFITKSNIQVAPELYSGAFTYSYPITSPPGRNGMQPDLSLGYNSGDSTNGSIVGYGWDLSIPKIERLTTYGVNESYSRHDFSSSLSGELEDVSLSDGLHGTYGAKIENGSYLTYTYSTGGSWTVKDKLGTTYEFGTSTDAQIVDSADSSRVAAWYLSKITDKNGNFVSYSYSKHGGQVYPDTISYTGHGSDPGIYSVVFTLESRDDVFTSFATGFSVETAYRVSEINAKNGSDIVRTYELDYTSGDNGKRSLLESITESATDASGNTVTKPPTEFSYTTSSRTWTEDTSLSLPIAIAGTTRSSLGVYVFDVNGDALPDIVHSSYQDIGPVSYQSVYINEGGNTWTEDTDYTIPLYFIMNNNDRGVRIADFNGDGFQDILSSRYDSLGVIQDAVYINNADGTGWTEDTSVSIPEAFRATNKLFDVNGDGYADILYAKNDPGDTTFTSRVYINNADGTGWTQNTNYTVPITFASYGNNDLAVRPTDVNGDGLADLVYARYIISALYQATYLNNGDGTWTQDTDYVLSRGFQNASGGDFGTRLVDVNNDGLADELISYLDSTGGVHTSLAINTGDGMGWTADTSFVGAPKGFTNGNSDLGAREDDYRGTSSLDLLFSRNINGVISNSLYTMDGGRADLLKTITYDTGASADVTYGTSSTDNPELSFPLTVVDSIETNDGFGNLSRTEYTYEDGSYYYADEHHKKFAGFGKVTTTDDDGNETVDYFHQGNSTNSSLGESTDDVSKIGKQYREEIYDDAGHLYQTVIMGWTNYDMGNDRDFVYNNQRLELLYDADTDHKDRATTYTYDTTYGNLTEEKRYGRVTGNNNGTFTDTGSDTESDTYDYAAWTTGGDSGYPSIKTLRNNANTRVTEVKWKYDNQSPDVVLTGNISRQSAWITGTTYAQTDYTYDSYGLVATVTDPLSHTTTYSPDSSHLYPATITDALSHATTYTYDYITGKPITVTDPNGFVVETDYDGFGRTLEVRKTVGSSTTAVQQYSYNDNFPGSVHETAIFNGSTAKESYTYFDGFGRPIQTRQEAEGTNTYNVADTMYDGSGRIEKTSLPYSSTGTSRTTATTDADLYATTTYDALNRPLTQTDAAGTSSFAYEDWNTVTTDSAGTDKEYRYDAEGRLVSVVEHRGANLYTTNYNFNPAGLLTKITDANSNIRNFTYDGLGRRLTAEDLHATTDTAFGTWTYTYDAAGNTLTTVSPNSITTTYTYDALNRVLTDNITSTGSTDTTYTYDSCTNGVGRLCSAAVLNGPTTSYTYDKEGHVLTEAKVISGTTYTTQYAYDYQGGTASVTYPDTSVATYSLDTDGSLEQVDFDDVHTTTNITAADNISHGPQGSVTSIAYGNGVTSTWDYDTAELYRLRNKTTVSGSAHIEDYDYTYDSVGNIKEIDDTSSLYAAMSLEYDYDSLNRLVHAQSTSTNSSLTYNQNWVYNAIGGITSFPSKGSYSYNGTATGNYANPHAPTSIGSTSLTYDNNGNMLTDGTWTNTWNYKNQLATSTSGTTVITYTYDQNGNRVKQSGGVSTIVYPNSYYTIDGTNVLRHILGGSLGSLATSTWNGTAASIIYHHNDHLGGTHVETDASGAAVEYVIYKPYGGTLLDSKTGSYENTLKYTEKEKDKNTGWYYYGARYYNADTGMFLSQDNLFLSIGLVEEANRIALTDPQQQNSYSYARNNPLINKDDTGNVVETVIDVVSLALSTRALYQNPSLVNGIFFGLDVVPFVVPGVPAAVGYVRNGAKTFKIVKYFDTVAELSGKTSISIAKVFADNIAFKFARRTWSAGEAGDSLASLVGHYVKHGAEVGAKNMTDYYNKANDLMGAEGTYMFSDPVYKNGDTVYYNNITHEKVVTNPAGDIKTYYIETKEATIKAYEDTISSL